MKNWRRFKSLWSNKPPNAIIWTRVSTEEQLQNNSLTWQLEKCAAFCREHNWAVLKIFTGEGETGYNYTQRSEFKRMIEYCKREHKNINSLVVYNSQRFARDPETEFRVVRELFDLGIKVHGPEKAFPEKSADVLLNQVVAVVNGNESYAKSEASIERMAKRAQDGYWMAKAPIGYSTTKEKGVLAVDPIMGPKVRQVFVLAGTGKYLLTELRGHAQKIGLRQPSGNPIDIKRLLERPLYCGRIPILEGASFALATFPAIVSVDQFMAAQKCIKVRQSSGPKAYKRLNPEFPLKSTLRCMYCSKHLTGGMNKNKRGKPYPYYWCAECTKQKPKPPNVRFSRAMIEEEFLRLLAYLQPTIEELRKVERKFRIAAKRCKEASEKSVLVQEEELKRLEAKLKRIREDYLADKLNGDQYSRLDTDIRASMEEARSKIKTSKPMTHSQVKAIFDVAREIFLHLAYRWRKGSLEERQAIQARVFPEGLVFDGAKFIAPRPDNVYRLLKGQPSHARLLKRTVKMYVSVAKARRVFMPGTTIRIETFEHSKTHGNAEKSRGRALTSTSLMIRGFEHPKGNVPKGLTPRMGAKTKMASPRGHQDTRESPYFSSFLGRVSRDTGFSVLFCPKIAAPPTLALSLKRSCGTS